MYCQDDPYGMSREEEMKVELRDAYEKIERLERELEDAQLENADLKADLRMVRSTADTAMEVIRTHRLKRIEVRGEIENPHVLHQVHDPEPDFERMRAALRRGAEPKC